MKRFLILAMAFVVALGLMGFGLVAYSSTKVSSAARDHTPIRPSPTQVTNVNSLRMGKLTRSWVAITSTAALSKSAPIIVVLSGIGANTSVESIRDRLIPYALAGEAKLIYPVAIKESWNVGQCCGAAAQLKVNDVGFLEKLVPRVDPGHKRPIYFVGYSNGGRLVYDLACNHPGLFDAMAIMKADPMPGCVVTKPQNVLVVSALDDPAVPFKAGEKGKETPAASIQIARLHETLGCPATSATARHGDMTITSWSSCTDGKRLAWAVYKTGGHNFPPPTATTPSGSQIIWSFFTKTALAPLPA